MAIKLFQGLKGSIVASVVEQLGLQTAIDKLPNEVSQVIQPVISVEPKKEILVANANFTTRTDKKTFIVGGTHTGDNNGIDGESFISATLVNGALKYISRQPDSAGGDTVTVTLNLLYPIELKKGTTVSIGGVGGGSVQYYEE